MNPTVSLRFLFAAIMSRTALYTLLPDRRSDEEQINDNGLENMLLEEEDLFEQNRGASKRYGPWIAYIISVLALSGLLVGIEHAFQINQRKCWNQFNYYCKRAVGRPFRIEGQKRLILTRADRVGNSFCQRCSCTFPLCQASIQRVSMVSESFQRASHSRCGGGLVRHNEVYVDQVCSLKTLQICCRTECSLSVR